MSGASEREQVGLAGLRLRHWHKRKLRLHVERDHQRPSETQIGGSRRGPLWACLARAALGLARLCPVAMRSGVHLHEVMTYLDFFCELRTPLILLFPVQFGSHGG